MERYKINLHAHTKYSDGSVLVKEVAESSREWGASVAIITDHVTHYKDWPGMDSKKYQQQKQEAELVSKELNYPIIIGAEIDVEGEECLVFGDEAITELLFRRDERIKAHGKIGYVYVSDFEYVRNKFNCGIILCHPRLSDWRYNEEVNFLKNGGLNVIDGYEKFNSGFYMFREDTLEDGRYFPDELKKMPAYSNSDTHCAFFECGYNIITRNITTEAELIDFIKNDKPIKLIESKWVKEKNNYIYVETEPDKYF